MKILVLEDNEELLRVINKGLKKEGYSVDCYTNGSEALENIPNGYNCFVLDINVPSVDGLSILKNIRDYLGYEIPVLIISSNHELEKIKFAYEKGCNDYIKKPFFIYELVQKIKNLCKIEYRYLYFDEIYKYNFKEQSLYKNDEKIILAKKEILFLDLFNQDLNKILSYEEIERFVWEGEITNIDNIRALIKRLRKKLPLSSIKIVTGLGYTLGEKCKFSK